MSRRKTITSKHWFRTGRLESKAARSTWSAPGALRSLKQIIWVIEASNHARAHQNSPRSWRYVIEPGLETDHSMLTLEFFDRDHSAFYTFTGHNDVLIDLIEYLELVEMMGKTFVGREQAVDA